MFSLMLSIGLVLFLVWMFVFKGKIPPRERKASRAAAFLVLLGILAAAISTVKPHTFSTPEEAYFYNYLSECECVVYGDVSARAVGAKVCLVDKEKDGWSIAGVTTVEHILSTAWGGVYFYPEGEGGNSYYVDILFVDELLVVSDSKNSTYVQLYDEERENYSYHAFVSEIDANYVLSINGEEYYVLSELAD